MLKHCLSLAALCATAAAASADDAAKAPCETMAAHLRAFAQEHPEQSADTGQWEFLQAAVVLQQDGDPAAPISMIPVQSFESLDSALQGIEGASVDDQERKRLLDIGFGSGDLLALRDLRPYSPHIILSQLQGTMRCDTGVMYRISGKRLAPIAETPGDSEGLCWSEGLGAFRVDHNAFASVETIDSEPGRIRYSVALMVTEPTVLSAENAACSVDVVFVPETFLRSVSKAPGEAHEWVDDLLEILVPKMAEGEHLESTLEKMRPNASGTSAYDEYLRASREEAPFMLRDVDPDDALRELPFPDERNYSGASFMDTYNLEFEGHRLILKFGTANFGWRTLPNNSFGLWEWDGSKLVPIASGDFAKRGSGPEVRVR